ncbi:MAG: acyltransferase [Opitutae bacterium]|nr:acyltransferase [Opitutae bacterium]
MKKIPRADIPSLTGLRFFAAGCIVLNHLLLGIAPARVFPWTAGGLAACGVLGMNLFFVLSGFIIHYNYSASLERFSASSLYGFISARIARLYPLLFVFIAFEFLTEEYIWRADPATANAHLRALPAFLTFSQTWFYQRLDSSLSLAYAFQNASITWSISTEFLMYLFYPALLHALLRPSESVRMRVGKLFVGVAILSLGVCWFHNHSEVVDQWGVAHFGEQAGSAYNPTHSFWLWFVFLSPYLRFAEFTIGALAAHLFMGLVERGPTRSERIGATAAMFTAAGLILLSMLPMTWRWEWELAYHRAVGYLPAVAVLIFGGARLQDGILGRAFAWRPFVWAGEASYSIYLIHIVFYNRFRVEAVSGPLAALRAVVTIGLIILTARVLFEKIENPARAWCRSVLQRLGETRWLVAPFTWLARRSERTP